ncbi:hypothetical protein A5889_002181 [Enterococcus sp. 9D6_DIV0238]|uniref:Mga helix-turn-helix domain-containing protein n=3 Tax=Enterococcus TaxID=1350 RepID=A0AAQ3W5L2_9ENTE
MSSIQKRRFQYIFAITDNRLRKGKHISDLNSDARELFDILKDFNDLSLCIKYFQYDYPISDDTFDLERLFFNFFSRAFTQFDPAYTRETRFPILKIMHTINNNIFLDISSKLSRIYLDKFHFVDSKDDLFYFSAFLLLFRNQFSIENLVITKINRGYSSNYIFQNNKKYHFSKEIISKELNKHSHTLEKLQISNLDILEEELSLIFYSIYKKNSIEKFTIFIEYSRNILGDSFNENFIQTIFNPELFQLVDSVSKAKIIITDSIGPRLDNKKYFFLEDIYDIHSLKRLTSFLLDEYLKTNFDI